MANDDILVTVKGMVPTPTGCGIFLGYEAKVIAIFVDHSVAAAITMSMHKIKRPRPLTHDLISSIFAGLGISVQKVVVNDLRDDTFYARLYLMQTNELGRSMVEIDARPSDSIAIALQQGCPIYVARKVWESAEDMTWALKQASQPAEDATEPGEPDEDITGEPPPGDEDMPGEKP